MQHLLHDGALHVPHQPATFSNLVIVTLSTSHNESPIRWPVVHLQSPS